MTYLICYLLGILTVFVVDRGIRLAAKKIVERNEKRGFDYSIKLAEYNADLERYRAMSATERGTTEGMALMEKIRQKDSQLKGIEKEIGIGA